jgi:Fur family ferric uptake transcriptional regulator
MKTNIEKEAVKLLSLKGLRRTGPRLVILSALLNAAEPLSQEQIAENIRGRGINKTTIYRTLASLVTADIVHEAVVRDRIQYYETACHCQEHLCHPHFICAKCRKTVCLMHTDVPSVSLPKGFAQYRQKIQIEGLCANCNTA